MRHPLLKAMRPKQWIKNSFVLAGLFFDGRLFEPLAVARTLAALAVFCAISSAIYLFNDLADIERDRMHPTKRRRPLASGALQPRTAQIAAVLLALGGLVAALLVSRDLLWVALAYVIVMTFYNHWLKHIVIVDVITVASGFVLRVHAGAVVVGVARFSPWLYVCTTLLALFIAINKRRHELVLLQQDANNHRAILEEYTLPFLDEMTSLVTATTLAAYSFYTFSAPNLPPNHSMMLTIPFVMYGILRYLYLIHVKRLGGSPEEIVLSDKPLLLSILLWGLTAGLALYWPR